ncbi:MAG: TAT-variant-translocated molybdopterin oxidoreductase [Saprospirales bacterium]|nr:TAT-variant-translocated molybdopterin oxidoreductase [Saprospirales bacterium]
MKNKNEVWIGVEQLNNDPVLNELSNQEFAEPADILPIVEKSLEWGSSRRDFLKYLGFSLGAATLAASCDIPVRRAIPYVIKPDTIVPGVATYYASTFVQGGDYCAVLVKTREGRPIKIEGNSLSKVTKGATSARAQAAVLSLYDTHRFPQAGTMEAGKFQKISWEELDRAVAGGLNAKNEIRIIADTKMSPTGQRVIAEFQAAYPNTKVVMYDAVSSSAMLEANAATLGEKSIPDYHFDKAEVILSFGADFLGTWISPIEYASQYAVNRKVDPEHPKMSRHIQVESHMSMTGSNADNRVLIKPSEMGAAIAALYNELAALNGATSVSAPNLNDKAKAALKKAAADLNAAKGKSLVVSGSNNIGEQTLVNAINAMLDSYGNTIDFTNASMQRKGIDGDIQGLIGEMNAGTVNAVFLMGANPAFDLPNAEAFKTAFAKVPLKVSFANIPDETTALCNYVAPAHHFLESWGDAEPKRGHYSLIQPTISPLFKTRQAEESLLRWAGSANLKLDSDQPYFDYLRWNWEQQMFAQQSRFATFQIFWDSTLHDGVFEVAQAAKTVSFQGDVAAAAAKVSKPAGSELEIAFFETVNQGAGQYAHNPWLQEMPDPVARTAWGNYLAIPISWDGGNEWQGFKNLNPDEAKGKADIVEVDVNGVTQRVTCVRQFGQPEGGVALALGYGRQIVGQAGRNVGVNVYPWLSIDANGHTQYYASTVSVSDKVAEEKEFACVQYHHTMGVKGIDPKTNEEINVDEKTVMTLGAGFSGRPHGAFHHLPGQPQGSCGTDGTYP